MSKRKTSKVAWVNINYFADGHETDKQKSQALDNLIARIRAEFPARKILICGAAEIHEQMMIHHPEDKAVEPPAEWYQDSWDDVEDETNDDSGE